jgi:hypothetical protein
VKILLAGVDESPQIVRVELSSESDLFFHYMHIVDEKEFLKIQETQKLVVDFIDYATVLIRMLNCCIKEPHIHLAILTIFTDNNNARLDFIQNMEYKFVELMYCNCIRSPEDIVQNHITFRYNAMKQKLSLTQNRLQEITNLVKIKNPSLLLQLHKSSGGNNTNNPNSTSNSPNIHHQAVHTQGSGKDLGHSFSGSSHNLFAGTGKYSSR